MTFSQKLDQWYIEFGRALPWRGIDDPYKIWLSEIILQQTRIEQGKDYYLRFIEAFPTVHDLATASEEQVLKLWQGLGYYTRARNLHSAARQIVKEWNGTFPKTYDEIRQLKGVGRYTAAAIASFAFRLPHPVIDGNVYRFVSRLHGIATPIGTTTAYNEFESLLLKEIDRQRPDRFNAAMMDFGSLQCRPQPDCTTCPFSNECAALLSGRVSILPVKPSRTKVFDRYFNYLDLRWNKNGEEWTVVEQRTGRDIWKGLYQLPLLETPTELDKTQLEKEITSFAQKNFQITTPTLQPSATYTHQLSHRTLHVHFFRCELASQPPLIPPKMAPMKVSEIKKIPVSRLIDRYLQKI